MNISLFAKLVHEVLPSNLLGRNIFSPSWKIKLEKGGLPKIVKANIQ